MAAGDSPNHAEQLFTDQKLFCTLCRNESTNPQLSPCGHTFCKKCFILIFRTGSYESRLTVNGATSNESKCYGSPKVFCPEGCGELKKSEFKPLIEFGFCPWCRNKINRSDLFKHMTQSCDKRSVECEYCLSQLEFANLEFHLKENCKSFPIPCEFGCGQEPLPRAEMVNSHYWICANHVRPCKYSPLGCCIKDSAPVVVEHERDVAFHEDLFFDRFLKQMAAFNELREEVGTLSLEKVQIDQSAKFKNYEDQLKVTAQHIEQMRKYYEEKLQEYDTQLKGAKEQIRKIEDEYSAKLKNCEERMKEMEFKITSAPNRNGIFIWEVQNVWQKIGKGSFYSDPFFTHDYGYKMCLSFYMMKEHLSLYLHIMKGQWDQYLMWPCKYEAFFILLDQKYDQHLQKSITSPEDDFQVVGKPTGERNSSWGVFKFVSIDDLRLKYLLDDTMMIKVIVNVKTSRN